MNNTTEGKGVNSQLQQGKSYLCEGGISINYYNEIYVVCFSIDYKYMKVRIESRFIWLKVDAVKVIEEVPNELSTEYFISKK